VFIATLNMSLIESIFSLYN